MAALLPGTVADRGFADAWEPTDSFVDRRLSHSLITSREPFLKAFEPSDRLERLLSNSEPVKVMLDRNLAELFEVETESGNGQVKRKIERFPECFMVELSTEQLEIFRRQLGTVA